MSNRDRVAAWRGFEALEQRSLFSLVTWDGGPGGTGTDWHDPVNWAGDQLPGGGDDVVINIGANPTIEINQGVTVKSIKSSEKMNITSSVALSAASLFLEDVDYSGFLFSSSANISFTGDVDWSAGTIATTGTVVIGSTGTLSLQGASIKHLQGDLLNLGTITWNSGGPWRIADATVTNKGTLNAGPVGGVTLTAFSNGTPSTFVNVGTLNKAGGGTVVFANDLDVKNTGTVNGKAGTLQFGKGVTGGAGTMNFTGGGHVFNAPSALGALKISAGLVAFHGATTAKSGTLSGGSLSGSGMFTINGVFGWTGGAMTGAGYTIVGSQGVLNIGGIATKSLQRQINNGGVTNWSGGVLQFKNGRFNNQAGHSFNASSGSVVQSTGGVNVFTNSGVFNKQGNNGVTFQAPNAGVKFSNSGTVVVGKGVLTFSGGVNQVSGTTLTGGKWTVSNGTTLTITGATIRTLGANAAVTLIGSTATFAGTGALTANNGIIVLAGGRTFTTTPNGGVFTNAGQLRIGAGSRLAVNGAFTQTNAPAATLRIDIGGLSPSQFGRVTATGALKIAGRLTTTLVNGFVPQQGDQFLFLTGASRLGNFTKLSLGSLPGGSKWAVTYLPTGVRLDVVSA